MFTYTKILITIILLFVGFDAAFLPYIKNRFVMGRYQPSNKLKITDLFARGIFIGIAVFHLIPHALKQLESHAYPITITAIVAALTIAIAYSIDLFFQKRARKHSGYCNHWIAYPTVVLLSVHSFFAGAALGFSENMVHMVIIGLALAIHKAAAGYSLGSMLQETLLKKKIVVFFIIIFAISTPMGILAAGHLSEVMGSAIDYVPAAAAGLFLYLGLTHNDASSVTASHRSFIKINSVSTGIAFIAGCVLMGALAFVI